MGIYSFNKANYQVKCLRVFDKWSFSDFYVDDHLTTIFFLDKYRRTIDCHFLLWKYDTSKLDHATLQKFDICENEEVISTRRKPCESCQIF